jgi:hypothetical protein
MPDSQALLQLVLVAALVIGGDAALPGLWWHAPFSSGGGYASEASEFVMGLWQHPESAAEGGKLVVRTTQHGDAFNGRYWGGLPKEVKDAQSKMTSTPMRPAGNVIVCHSEPGAWAPALYKTSHCPPRGDYDTPLRVVARTMGETDRLTPEHAARINKMDEVWVPTAFQVATFTASGIDPAKIRVVPEAGDALLWAQFVPLLVAGRSSGMPSRREPEDHREAQSQRA